MHSNLRAIVMASIAFGAATATAHAADNAPAGPADQAVALDEIIVTGEKANRSLQDTITSIRVVTAVDIEQENLLNVYDVIARTANLTATFGNSGFNIRGISNSNITGVGTGDLATVYLDGSPLPREALAGPLDLWDLAQIEVLRGPQSTLQGRNALAGSIILRTTDPTFEWSGRARAIVTNEIDSRRFAVAVGGPIIADEVAFRISGEHSRTDGLTRNPTLNDDRVNRRDGDNIRAKLLVTPKAIPGLRIVGTYFHDKHENGENYSFTDVPDSWENRTILSNRRASDVYKSDFGTLEASYDISQHLALTSITTFSRIRNSITYDGDNLPVDQSYGGQSKDQKTFTQETRLNLNTDSLSALIGVYYSHLSNKHDRSYSTFSLSPVDDLGLPAALGAIYPSDLYVDTLQFYPQVVKAMALFGDATWEAAPGLKLRAGFRWDQENQSRANNNIVTLVTTLPNPADYSAVGLDGTIAAINGLIGGFVAQANSSSPAAKTRFRAFLPKGGVTYEFTPDASLSATIQRGYRSGGSGVNPGMGQLYTYDPEFTWNYEIAFRSLWLDRKLSLNANAFYIDWTDQQVIYYPPPRQTYNYLTVNAGTSRVYGFEIESRYQPNRNVTVYASAGYSNTKFKKFVIDTTDYSGAEFSGAPRWTLAAGGTWEAPEGWFVNLNANYRSAAYQNLEQFDGRELKARVIANAKIGWQNDNFGVFVTGTNLFNKRYFDYQYMNGARRQGLLGEPRVLGLLLEARF
jgi:iron complex outermembrane receptor protein